MGFMSDLFVWLFVSTFGTGRLEEIYNHFHLLWRVYGDILTWEIWSVYYGAYVNVYAGVLR